MFKALLTHFFEVMFNIVVVQGLGGWEFPYAFMIQAKHAIVTYFKIDI
jgi:hypothetical protein